MSTCNYTIDSSQCTLATCCLDQASVGYIPDLAGNVAYLAIFALLIFPQLGLGIYFKTWGFMIAMEFGLVLEVVGYAGRVMLHDNVFDDNAFLIYIICLTIAPAFTSAAIYLCFGRIVEVFGRKYSRVSPRTYSFIFVSCDILSLVLQAAGGGLANASNNDTAQTGINIMLAGLAFQVFSILLFIVLGGEVMYRIWRSNDAPNPQYADLLRSRRFRGFLWSVVIATILIFIRCVYRVAELSEGFGGSIANNEPAFMVLEGPMIFLAITLLTCFHPGIGFCGRWEEAEYSFTKKATNGEIKLTAMSQMNSEAEGIDQQPKMERAVRV